MFIKREEYEALQRKNEIQQLYISALYERIALKTFSLEMLKKDMDFARGIDETDAAYSETVSSNRQYQKYSEDGLVNEYAKLAGVLEERMKQELKKDIQDNPGEDAWKRAYRSTLREYIPRIVRLVYKAEEDRFDMDLYTNAKEMKRLIKTYGGFRL